MFLPRFLLLLTSWAPLLRVQVSVFASVAPRFLPTRECPLWLLASQFCCLFSSSSAFHCTVLFPFSQHFLVFPRVLSWSVCSSLRVSSLGSSSIFGSFTLARGFAVSLASSLWLRMLLSYLLCFPLGFSSGLGSVFSRSFCSFMLSFLICSSFLLCSGLYLFSFLYSFICFWVSVLHPLEPCPCW